MIATRRGPYLQLSMSPAEALEYLAPQSIKEAVEEAFDGEIVERYLIVSEVRVTVEVDSHLPGSKSDRELDLIENKVAMV